MISKVDQETVAATLAGIWRAALRTDHIDDDSDFFALGGHSLLAIRVSAYAAEAFGVAVPPGDLLGDSSFPAMVARIQAARPNGGSR